MAGPPGWAMEDLTDLTAIGRDLFGLTKRPENLRVQSSNALLETGTQSPAKSK